MSAGPVRGRLAALLLLAAASACASAADEAPNAGAPGAAGAAVCRDCGVVQDIRRLALPISPRVDPLGRPPGQER